MSEAALLRCLWFVIGVYIGYQWGFDSGWWRRFKDEHTNA